MFKPDPVGISLFSLRVSLFIFMAMWALLKVLTPASYGVSDNGAGIFGSFYGIEIGTGLVTTVGIAQILFLLAFVVGAAKLITYGGVLLMNIVTLLVSFPTIVGALSGSGNILFAASLPVLGASLALFLMRGNDNFLTVQGSANTRKLETSNA